MSPGPAATRAEAAELVARLRSDAAVAEGHVREVTGLGHGLPLLPADVVDRPGLGAAAVHGMRCSPRAPQLPAVSRVGPRGRPRGPPGCSSAGWWPTWAGGCSASTTRSAGPDGDGPAAAGGAQRARRAAGARTCRPADFGLWVCLHEATHRLQFTAVPWLRAYFADEVGRFLSIARSAAGPDGERPALLERLPEIAAGDPHVRRRLAGHRRAAAGPGAAGRARPAARADHAAGGPRRPRDGRGRPGGGARAWRRSGPGSPPAGAAAG